MYLDSSILNFFYATFSWIECFLNGVDRMSQSESFWVSSVTMEKRSFCLCGRIFNAVPAKNCRPTQRIWVAGENGERVQKDERSGHFLYRTLNGGLWRRFSSAFHRHPSRTRWRVSSPTCLPKERKVSLKATRIQWLGPQCWHISRWLFPHSFPLCTNNSRRFTFEIAGHRQKYVAWVDLKEFPPSSLIR